MSRIEYSLSVPCPRRRVWSTLMDWENWPNWPKLGGVYGHVYWKEGKPFEVGSRFVFEHRLMVGPLPVTFDASLVITAIRPPEFIKWINHGAGITVEQVTELYARGRRETFITTSLEFLGELLKGAPAGVDVEKRLRELIVSFYDALADEAQTRFARQAGSTRSKRKGA